MELSLRNRITVVREHKRRPWADRVLEVLDDSVTGEVLLDETLRYMKNDSDTITNWIDYLSGETWNLLKIGYQLKQVRERIAKGLVDKGVLRTEKKNFLIFDMATHPLSDSAIKKKLIGQVLDVLFSKNPNPDARTIALVCAVYAANLLENVTSKLSYSQREAAFTKADEILRNNLNLSDASKENGMTDVIVGVINVYSKLDSVL
jgi:Golgi phosphoprotein 3